MILWGFCLPAGAQTFTRPTISNISIYDRGLLTGEADLAVDLVRESCGAKDQNGDGDTTDPGDLQLEPFSDTLISLTIDNPGSAAITVSKLRYRIPRAGKLNRWMGGLAPVSPGYIPAKSSKAVSFFLFKSDALVKRTFKPSIILSEQLGFKNLSLKLDLRSGSGRVFQLSQSIGVSFGNEDRCTE